MYQIVTRALGVAAERVFISETSTDKVSNASPSAASMSTDLYGAAVQVSGRAGQGGLYCGTPLYRV